MTKSLKYLMLVFDVYAFLTVVVIFYTLNLVWYNRCKYKSITIKKFDLLWNKKIPQNIV